MHFNRVNQKQVPPLCLRKSRGLGKAGIAAQDPGTTGVPPSASKSSAGEVVALGLNRSFSKLFKIKWPEKELNLILIKILIKIKSFSNKFADQNKGLIKKKS